MLNLWYKPKLFSLLVHMILISHSFMTPIMQQIYTLPKMEHNYRSI